MEEYTSNMNTRRYFSLYADKILSDFLNHGKTHERLLSRKNSGNRIFKETRCFRRKKSTGKNNSCHINGLENLETDLARKKEAEKLISFEFTEKAASIYLTKFKDLLLKQETEINELKEKFVRIVKSEIEQWQEHLNYVKQEEKKLMNFFKHLHTVYNSPQFQNGRLRKLADMETDFFQEYNELVAKHNSEVRVLKDTVKEEVNEVKLILSREFCRKESGLKKNSTCCCTKKGGRTAL